MRDASDRTVGSLSEVKRLARSTSGRPRCVLNFSCIRKKDDTSSAQTVREHEQLHSNLDPEDAGNIMRWRPLTGHHKSKQNIQKPHDILRDENEANVRTQTCTTTSVLLFEKMHDSRGYWKIDGEKVKT